MSYMVATWKVNPEGESPGPGWAPGRFEPNPKYGFHSTNLDAKRAYLAVHAPGWSNLSAEKVKGQFHSITKANSFSKKNVKILKVDNPQCTPQPIPEASKS
jgi:hypothetical protein